MHLSKLARTVCIFPYCRTTFRCLRIYLSSAKSSLGFRRGRGGKG